MQTGTFFRKYLLDMADEQREKNGAVPYVVPDVLTIGRQLMAEPSFDQTSPDWGEAGSCVWGDAATIIPWNMYLHSGNVSRLAEQYDNMKQWTDFIMYMDEKHCDGSRLWTCGFHFGDWLSLDVEGGTKDESNCKGGTDRYFIASVFYMYAARLTAKAAKILGYDEDAGKYGKRADEVRTAIRNKYLDKSSFGKLLIRTQTAYAVAIHLDIFEEKEKDAAGKELEALVHEWKDHLATGFVGTAFLCDALTQTGHVDLAYTLLFNEDYPSWLYEVNLGATTIWERWNSILPDGKISGTGMNSLNHYAYGVIVEWIYKSVCGLNLDEEHPAGQRIIFSPHPDKRLGSVTAKVNFAKGSYEAGWKLSEDKVTLNCTVPFGGELLFRPDFKLENILFDGNKVDNDFFKDVITCGTHTIEGKIMSR